MINDPVTRSQMEQPDLIALRMADLLQRIQDIEPGGTVFYVDADNGSDSNDGLSYERAMQTVDAAYTAAVSGRNDIIFLSGNGTHTLTSMLDISKDRVNFVGAGKLRKYGQAAKISLTATAGATNIATVKNTGIRNSFTNIKFMNSSTVNEGLYCFAEGGEYTVFDHCEFYKDTDLDETLASEFLLNGDSTQFYDCTFGSLANIVADNVIRPNVKVTATLSGKKCRDAYFDNCLFWTKAGGTEHVDVYGANATDVERMLTMKECLFINSTLAAADPAHAVGFGAAQTEGTVFLVDCASTRHTVMAQAAVGIGVAGAVPTFATAGVAVLS